MESSVVTQRADRPSVSFTVLAKNRNRSAYAEVLEKLKKEFTERWDSMGTSGTEGLDAFVRIRTLGVGSFGRVLLVKRTENDTDSFYAMKAMNKSSIMRLQQLHHTLNERRILEAIRYPFIVNLECSFKDNSYVYLVMPFVNGGELFTLLRKKRKLTEQLARFYAAQAVLALEFLHYIDILYRDLKPENILIDDRGYIKLADLGFCKIVKGRTWTLCGTPEYIAPEIILSKGYEKSIDWWSFGVLVYEMNAGYLPFASNDTMEMYDKITTSRYKCPHFFSPGLQDIVKNLLQVDLSRRYGTLRNGTQDIRNHRWFQDVDWYALYNKQVEPPFVPQVKSASDADNFQSYKEQPLRISTNDRFKAEFEGF